MYLPDEQAVRALGAQRHRLEPGLSSALVGKIMVILDRAFEALADPTRRSLLHRLAEGPQPAGDLAEPFDISRPAISRHLRVLREAELVEVEAVGRARVYRLSQDGLDAVRSWMTELSEMWDEALVAFKEHAEARR